MGGAIAGVPVGVGDAPFARFLSSDRSSLNSPCSIRSRSGLMSVICQPSRESFTFRRLYFPLASAISAIRPSGVERMPMTLKLTGVAFSGGGGVGGGGGSSDFGGGGRRDSMNSGLSTICWYSLTPGSANVSGVKPVSGALMVAVFSAGPLPEGFLRRCSHSPVSKAPSEEVRISKTPVRKKGRNRWLMIRVPACTQPHRNPRSDDPRSPDSCLWDCGAFGLDEYSNSR